MLRLKVAYPSRAARTSISSNDRREHELAPLVQLAKPSTVVES